MIKWILQKIVGSKNQREVRRIRPTVARINEIEEALQREPEEKLREMTRNWQAHLARYHALDVPAKPIIERMDAEELRATAEALEARLAPLREEFPVAPRQDRRHRRIHRGRQGRLPRNRSRVPEIPRQVPRKNPARGLRRRQKRRPPPVRHRPSPSTTTRSSGKWSISTSSSSAASPCTAA